MHRYYAECKKRASLVPAAAVIPALRAYIKVVAFKTPVVEIAWRASGGAWRVCVLRGQGFGRGKRGMGWKGGMKGSRGAGGRESGRESEGGEGGEGE